MHLAGKTAQQDIMPVLCPTAMNHATTLRIMERLRADEFTYEVNAGGALPLGRHRLCSMVWRRRVYRAAQQVEVSTLRLVLSSQTLTFTVCSEAAYFLKSTFGE